jgi:hypothetical protein
MSESIRKSHNVSVIMYHIVCSAKYRRTVITGEGDKELKEICKAQVDAVPVLSGKHEPVIFYKAHFCRERVKGVPALRGNNSRALA